MCFDARTFTLCRAAKLLHTTPQFTLDPLFSSDPGGARVQIAQSVWIDGVATSQAGAERVPYWLNGMVPLHTLLRNADPSSAETHATAASTSRYLAHILAAQDPSTGWLGPNVTGGDVFWSRFYLLMALQQGAEGSVDAVESQTLVSAMLRHVHATAVKMDAVGWNRSNWTSPGTISKIRLQDYLTTLQWLMEVAPSTEQPFLEGHSQMVQQVVRPFLFFSLSSPFRPLSCSTRGGRSHQVLLRRTYRCAVSSSD